MIEPGMTLGERYKLTKTLGEGGMANVYLAHDLILDRDVAVKVLRLDLQNDQGTLRRFRREAMATLELNHPHIISIYDMGEMQGQQYLIMEYVKGTNLKTYIAANFPIPYAKVIAIMTQILSAVQEAHDHNIIHRDLKPQNIMVDESGAVKIADFGIAVALSDNAMTQTNSLLGSVHYLSPEQARGSMPTRQSDIYALGIILYELLTGRVPFEGDSAVTVALKHFQEEIPSVKAFDPRIPQALENVVLKATAKDPNQRYTSAEAMADDLATALSQTRAHEPKFIPHVEDDLGETRVMTDLPSAMRHAQPDDQVTQEIPVVKPNTQAKDAANKPTSRKKWWLIGGVATLFALLIGLALVWPKGDVDVPNVTGMTVSEARQALSEAKLRVGDQKSMADDEVADGKVIRTNPQRGISVKSGSEVALIISSGVGSREVDDYVGESFKDAAKELKKQGFRVKKKLDHESSEAKGTVLHQSIKAGRRVVAKGRTVTLTVSAGREALTMPDLTKYNYQGVMGYAEDHNLNVTVSGDTTGLVIGQTPVAGSTIYDGDTINVIFGSGYTESVPYVSESNNQVESSSTETSVEESSSTSETTSSSTSSSSVPSSTTPSSSSSETPEAASTTAE